jgi:ABC-type nitrate/sulfonate/bicarbonate transport system substrate-binding protein
MGLQFVETECQGSSAMVDAMVAGSLDTTTSIGSVSVLSAAERGLIPDKIVPIAAHIFVDPEHPQIGVLVSNPINSWQDLKGQQIAINAKTLLTSGCRIRK